MAFNNVLAGIASMNFEKSLNWYEKLLNSKPDSQPMEGVAEWKFDGGGWLQLFADSERAGDSSITLSVDDLDKTIRKLSELDIEVGEQTDSDIVKTAKIIDPDGNQIILAEAMSSAIAR